jgi:hypothetical protein
MQLVSGIAQDDGARGKEKTMEEVLKQEILEETEGIHAGCHVKPINYDQEALDFLEFLPNPSLCWCGDCMVSMPYSQRSQIV